MKLFLKKTILFFAFYVCFVCVIKESMNSPYFWGNNYFLSKKKVFEEQDSVNTVFFGSSRIYRQIVPSIFDSIINRSLKNKIRSFNFGCPATFPPESYMLLENFIREKKGIKYVFLELNECPSINSNVFTTRGNYWMNIREFLFVNKMINQSTSDNATKQLMLIWSARFQSFLTLHNVFSHEQGKESYAGPFRDGYYSLEQQVKDERENSNLKARHLSFFRDTLVLRERVKVIANEMKEAFHFKNKNKAHAERLESLFNLCKKENIHLVFLLTPRVLNREIASLFVNLPLMNKLELSDPELFPGLYLAQYSYDDGHLNEKGARYFTQLLADKFIHLQTETEQLNKTVK